MGFFLAKSLGDFEFCDLDGTGSWDGGIGGHIKIPRPQTELKGPTHLTANNHSKPNKMNVLTRNKIALLYPLGEKWDPKRRR